MTRGNQRELARKKAAKKDEQAKKAQGKGSTEGNRMVDRKQRDADIMRQKQEKAKAKQDAAGASGGK